MAKITRKVLAPLFDKAIANAQFILRHALKRPIRFRCFRCFRCFGGKFTASTSLFLAEILGFRSLSDGNNSDIARCFSLFFLQKQRDRKAALPYKSLHPLSSMMGKLNPYHESISLSIE